MTPHERAVIKHGEIFTGEADQSLKASMKASTKATFSLAARACYFEGTIQKGAYVGEYLMRKLDGKKYLLNTAHLQPKTPTLEYIFATQCNQIVTLARPVNVDAGSNPVTQFVIYQENVPAFKDTTTRSLKEQNDGLIPQDITIMLIPARYGIQKLDRIYVVKNGLPLDKCQRYRVESLNDALSPINELIDHSGVDLVQLSEDKTPGDAVEEPAEPTGLGDGGGGWW